MTRITTLVLVGIVLGVVAAGCGGSHAKPNTATRAAARPSHPRAPAPITFTVEASGDLLIHTSVWERALAYGGGRTYDFVPMFARVEPYIHGADLALCHVETPMTPAPPTGYPVFNTPPALARAIHQVGFRVCSTAATHTLDQGQTGVSDTAKYLDQAGVLHAGSYASAAAQRKPVLFTVKGVRVAFLSYTDITNGIPSPHPWSVNRANAPQILAEAHRARQAGAQVVIVNIHWGDQYVNQPSAFQMQLASQLTRSPDITAIVGQHVHIPQPIRMINGKLVVFGEGNLISNQTDECCPTATEDGFIALLTIVVEGNRSRVTFIHYVPIWVRHPDFVIEPAGLAMRYDPGNAAVLRASYERTVAAVGRSAHVQPIPAHIP
jgi:poly-gamma-glutamate synthesis protein (capsule biosynthesis protein)